MDLLSERPAAAKVVPALALVIPVTFTVVTWIASQEARTPATLPLDTPLGMPTGTALPTGEASTPPSLTSAFDARVVTLEAHLSLAPEDRNLRLTLARLLHDGHREQEAIVQYRKALDMDPDDRSVYFDLATALASQGDWSGAEEILLARLDRAPDDAVAMYDLGAVEANRGNVESAEHWWRNVQAAAMDEALASSAARALSQLTEAQSR